MEFYDIEVKWKNITIELESDNLEIIEKNLKEFQVEYEVVGTTPKIRITNQQNLLLFEIEFLISHKNQMKTFFSKISKKVKTEKFVYYGKTFEIIEYNNRFTEYEQCIDHNRIDTGTILESSLKINPEFWLLLLNKYSKVNTNSEEIIVLENLFVLSLLLLISEKTVINSHEEKHIWTFNIDFENKEILKKVRWDDIFNKLDNFEAIKDVYEWLISENMFETKIQIIRNYFKYLTKIEFSKDMLSDLKSMYHIVLLQQTDTYFKQQNKLLNVLVDIKKDEMKKNSELLTKLLALLTTFGLGIYGKILSSDNTKDSIIKILNSDETLSFLLWVFFVCIIFLTLSYYMNFKDKKDYIDKLKIIYKDQFQINEDSFKYIEKEVDIFRKSKRKYWIILFSIILITVTFLIQLSVNYILLRLLLIVLIIILFCFIAKKYLFLSSSNDFFE